MAGRRRDPVLGDIDTHGFAILDRLRAWLPQTRSVLMDRDTLLAHRDRWVTEDRPAKSALLLGSLPTSRHSIQSWWRTAMTYECAWNRSGSTGSGSRAGYRSDPLFGAGLQGRRHR